MKYAVVSTAKAKEMGIDPRLHRTSKAGTRIILNENELLRLVRRQGEGDNLSMAQQLGGDALLSERQVRERVRSWNK